MLTTRIRNPLPPLTVCPNPRCTPLLPQSLSQIGHLPLLTPLMGKSIERSTTLPQLPRGTHIPMLLTPQIPHTVRHPLDRPGVRTVTRVLVPLPLPSMPATSVQHSSTPCPQARDMGMASPSQLIRLHSSEAMCELGIGCFALQMPACSSGRLG